MPMLWIVGSVFLFLIILESGVSFWMNKGTAKKHREILDSIRGKIFRNKSKSVNN
ncbi:hypothetical protein [Bacillus sp. V59.32b]|uniref:hypothetical protein n=1 Tax=Bacillus sp. V59.32b TaxID=1758642 RepID=UPI001358D746|nr:hypothetical protein [Bacillus sp. V59.32b]